jgi:outer membrane protein TolC
MIKIYTFAAICSLAAVSPATGQTLTIDSCHALATRNYPLVKQYGLIEKTAEYTLSNASKAHLPQVSITAIEGYIFGGLSSLGLGPETQSSNFKFIGIAQVNQTIWDGGATKTQKKIITASSEADKASVDVAMHELRSRVDQLYFGILMVTEQLSQLEIQSSILNSNVSRIKQLVDNGLAYNTDLNEIKVEQLKLNQKRTELKYTRSGYLSMLSLLIGVKLNDQATLTKPLASEVGSDLPFTRPELSLYNSQRNLLTSQASMQRVGLMPKIGVLGAGLLLAPGIGGKDGGTSSIGVAGLSASWSITGLYKNANEKALTQQSLSKVDVQEETFRFNTNLQLSQSSANIEKQKALLAEDEEIVSLRKIIRDSYQLKYDAGTSPLMDLLSATDKESDARAQKSLHELQLLMTLYEYKTTTGN